MSAICCTLLPISSATAVCSSATLAIWVFDGADRAGRLVCCAKQERRDADDAQRPIDRLAHPGANPGHGRFYVIDIKSGARQQILPPPRRSEIHLASSSIQLCRDLNIIAI
jgi:hypothetical protein